MLRQLFIYLIVYSWCYLAHRYDHIVTYHFDSTACLMSVAMISFPILLSPYNSSCLLLVLFMIAYLADYKGTQRSLRFSTMDLVLDGPDPNLALNHPWRGDWASLPYYVVSTMYALRSKTLCDITVCILLLGWVVCYILLMGKLVHKVSFSYSKYYIWYIRLLESCYYDLSFINIRIQVQLKTFQTYFTYAISFWLDIVNIFIDIYYCFWNGPCELNILLITHSFNFLVNPHSKA